MFNYKHVLISIASIGSLLTMLLSIASQYTVISLSVFSLMWAFAIYRHAKDTEYDSGIYELSHLLTTFCFSFGLFNIAALIAFKVYSPVEPMAAYALMTSALVYSINYPAYVWIKLNRHPNSMEGRSKPLDMALLCTFVALVVCLIDVIVTTIQKHPII